MYTSILDTKMEAGTGGHAHPYKKQGWHFADQEHWGKKKNTH